MTNLSQVAPSVNRGEPQPLTVHASRGPVWLGRENVSDWHTRIESLGECANAWCDLAPLATWPLDEARAAVRQLAVMSLAANPVRFRGAPDGNVGGLLEASFNLIPQSADLDQIDHGIQLAIEAAIAAHPTSLDLAAGQLLARLRAVGVRSIGIRGVRQRLIARMRELETSGGESGESSLADLFPDVAGAQELVCPEGWSVDDEGVSQGRTRALNVPLIALRLFRDAETGRESVELAWRFRGETRRRIVEGVQVSAASQIVALSGYGLPVTSNNSPLAVQYLNDFLAANPELQTATTTGHLGWHRGCSEFLWGRQLIVGGDAEDQPSLLFVGQGDGDAQLCEGYSAAGTLEGWREAVRPIAAFPRVQLAVYAALGSVLLEPLESANFVLSFAGETSSGKTSTLRLAGSVWGCPDEDRPAAVVGTWDATRVWIERSLGILHSKPLILDDTKRARRRGDVAQTVYDATSGRGRGRGDVRGTVEVASWRTILISTGEEPLTAFSADGGTRARILELWGSPFGGASPEIAAQIASVQQGIAHHFGHAGPQFVRFLLAHRERWDEWRGTFQRFTNEFRERAGNNPVAGRMAPHLAVLRLAEQLAHEALELPWPAGDVVNLLYSELTSEVAEADRASTALDYVIQWARANKSKFEDQFDGRTPQPHEGWAGRWTVRAHDEGGTCPVLAFVPFRLDQILGEGGFEPAAVRRTWRDRGWLRHSQGKTTLKMRVGSSTREMVAIWWSVIHAREADGVEPPLRGEL